jgi:hypothetical protein
MHVAQGGKFGAGFASGFVTGGFAVNKSWGTVESRTVVAALVGGVTSEITGGKFANGAITGAFVHLFNSEGRSLNRGRYTRTFKDREALSANMKDGDIIFGKRPLSIHRKSGFMEQATYWDKINAENLHEHVFYKKDGVLYDIGYSPDGTFSEDVFSMNEYVFSNQTYHTSDFSIFSNNPSGFTGDLYKFFTHNCQDYSDYIFSKL